MSTFYTDHNSEILEATGLNLNVDEVQCIQTVIIPLVLSDYANLLYHTYEFHLDRNSCSMTNIHLQVILLVDIGPGGAFLQHSFVYIDWFPTSRNNAVWSCFILISVYGFNTGFLEIVLLKLNACGNLKRN